MTGSKMTNVDETPAMAAGRLLFDTVENGDLEQLHDIFAPGAVVWHNTDNALTDIPTTIRNLENIRASATEFRYEDIRRKATVDGFVQQHTLVVKMPGGRTIHDMGCCICTVVDGRITHMDAYHDSAATGAMAHKANDEA
jgi:ketosteroid isomerase-like protein